MAAATPPPSFREGPADRRARRGAVGEGFGRRQRIDQARRFSTLYMDKLRALKTLYRGVTFEDEMVGLPAPCDVQPQPARRLDRHPAPRLRAAPVRRSHAPRCDHRDRGEQGQSKALTKEIFGDEIGWLPWKRPGFELGLWLGKFCEEHPKAKGVILESHGLFTWGDTPKDCYETTIATINKAIAWLETKTGASRSSVAKREASAGGRTPFHRGAADAGDPRAHRQGFAEARSFR